MDTDRTSGTLCIVVLISGERRGVVATKWDGTLNFSLAGVVLGDDANGCWLGMEAGWTMERATRTLTIPYGCVLYVPRDRGYLARFCDPSSEVRAPLYCDITTIPQWSGDAVHMIDLDLDVVRDQQGSVYAVDEDEFTANTARFRYPDEVVAGARDELHAVMEMIRSKEAPFGTEAADFLELVTEARGR